MKYLNTKIRKACLSLLIMLFAFCFNAQSLANINPTQNSPNECLKLDNDKALIKQNPGYYYFGIGYCKFKYIHDSQTLDEVINLLNKSIEYHYSPATFVLATLYFDKYTAGSTYFNVKGKPNDLSLAISNYEKAAQAGSSTAGNVLGEIYLDNANLNEQHRQEDYNARDVKDDEAPVQLPDLDKAVYWLTLAAKSGNPAAQGTLSDLYRQGIGVPQDYVQAYLWQNLSAASQSRFNPRTGTELGRKLNKGDTMVRDNLYSMLTTEQKNEVQNLLKEYSKSYFVKPNTFEQLCGELQRDMAARNLSILFNEADRRLKNFTRSK